jgi:hypothetical protein
MKALLPVLVIAALGVGCQSDPTAPSLPATVTLAPGESATADSVRVTFVKVTSDTRCPINALCIQAGDAVAQFRTTVRGNEATSDLALVDPTRRFTIVGGVTVEFDNLQPHPVGGQTTDPKTYRATVTIRQ